MFQARFVTLLTVPYSRPSMLNLAGASYDFGSVVFAVLQECEHHRRGLLAGEAPDRLQEIARRKLAEIRVSIALPFIPIWEDAFAFLLAGAGFLYPEIRKTAFDYRHSRLLNQLISDAETYQKSPRLHYLSQAEIEQELGEMGTSRAAQAESSLAAPAAFPGRERGKQGQSGPG